MKLGKPIKYIAVSPTEVVERVKKNMRASADEKIKRLENLKTTDVLGELNSLHSQGIELIEPSDLSCSLRGRNNLYNHLELTLKNAEKSYLELSNRFGWHQINCAPDKTIQSLRNAEEISTEVFSAVEGILKS